MVFSKDFPRARKMANRIKAGSVWINTYDCFDATLPFGGFKAFPQPSSKAKIVHCVRNMASLLENTLKMAIL